MTTPPPGSPLIQLRQAAIGYDDRPAVAEIDFTLHHGEAVALIGANGAGKTTLVRGILGLARVLAGEVTLFGRPADKFTERFRIGYVPQRHTVGGPVPSTVEEVVASGRLPRKPLWGRMNRADREVVAGALTALGLSELRHCPVSILSGGQQRRTLIARALASQPDVLVMDEPTAGVDAANQAELARTLTGLVGQGLTLLVVTHEVAPLLPVLTRVVTVEAGRIIADLPVQEALTVARTATAGAPTALTPVPTTATTATATTATATTTTPHPTPGPTPDATARPTPEPAPVTTPARQQN